MLYVHTYLTFYILTYSMGANAFVGMAEHDSMNRGENGFINEGKTKKDNNQTNLPTHVPRYCNGAKVLVGMAEHDAITRGDHRYTRG